MFAPSITGRVRVNPQHASSCSPDRSPSASAAANAQELRLDFPGEVFGRNDEAPAFAALRRGRRITRMSTGMTKPPPSRRYGAAGECRMSNEYLNRQSTVENLTSDLRLLTSAERGPIAALRCRSHVTPTKAFGFYVARTAHRRRHHRALAGVDGPDVHASSKAGPTSPAPRTPSKACSTPRAPTPMANNTYTWVGFYEENVANPCVTQLRYTGCGRFSCRSLRPRMERTSDDPSNSVHQIRQKLVQVGKLTKIDNVHLCR